MRTNKTVAKSILYVSLLVFIVFVIYILYQNRYVLFTAQDRSEFLPGVQFFSNLLSRPFGLMQYAGGWLTQYFYNPVLGASILSAIWVVIFFVGIKAYRLKESAIALMLIPVAFLLTSIVDLGYWIYEFDIKGYWFSQSVGYLFMLILLWAARCTPRKYHIIWYILAACLYPVLGWFAILFAICLMVTEEFTWGEWVGIFVLFTTANIWHIILYSHMNIKDVLMAGMPDFETPGNDNLKLSIPFWLIGAVSILSTLFGKYLSKTYVPVLCAVVGMVFTWTFMYQDKNYTNEMRMVRYAEDDNWEEVLNVFAESPKPTISMVMLKNIALMNEGGVLDKSFKMGNDAATIYNPDSVRVSFLEIAAPVAYYNYGLINEGFRLAFECAVQSGFSPFYLRQLARCARANGEEPLVERYISQLKEHPLYKEWQPKPATSKIYELKNSYPNELSGIENSDSYLINSISVWYEADSKIASEQALLYSMLRCDPRRFWPALRKYFKMHEGEEFPLHAQEAYIIFMDRAPEEKKMRVPVSEEVYERYNKFWEDLENLVRSGINQSTVPDKMRADYGDTYWWFNIFGRKIY